MIRYSRDFHWLEVLRVCGVSSCESLQLRENHVVGLITPTKVEHRHDWLRRSNLCISSRLALPIYHHLKEKKYMSCKSLSCQIVVMVKE